VRRALEEPLRQIVANAGMEGSIVVQKVRDGKADFGFNARTEVYENLLAAGVIDPTKVTRVALENAASIAAMLLTTECVISDEKEEKAAGHSHGTRHGRHGRHDVSRPLFGSDHCWDRNRKALGRKVGGFLRSVPLQRLLISFRNSTSPSLLTLFPRCFSKIVVP
jgi:hypothetical protein